MDKTQQNFAVMFADIAGSTRIYERLGDTVANQMISGALELVSGIIKNYQGVIVKTIGDEVMCRFAKADNAINCACEIHETMVHQPIQHGMGLAFRIGIHWGAALLQNDGDIFGDAVNLAARMTGIAKARQIITTNHILNKLSTAQLISKCREIDRVEVKGKAEPISIIEVMWEPNDVTRMSTIISNNVSLVNDQPLHIYYQYRKKTLKQGAASYTFGRDTHCDQMIGSSLVSRVHAKIECRRGKFILIDESTNGTYLKIDDKPPIYLRREEMPLQGSGIISFGEELPMNSEFLLHFNF